MTNWEKFYGSPESVAETMDRMNRCAMDAFGAQSCKGCFAEDSEKCKSIQLEWLQEEAE